jgi:DNA invertase Pin-like site-specific DNA recombinase
MTERIAIYARVSTRDQTVEHQLADLRAYCDRTEAVVVHEYIDEGISGTKGRDKRAGLDNLLRDAVSRRFDKVVVAELSRIGRSMPDFVANLNTLMAAGVHVTSLREGIDTSSAMGKAMTYIAATFAEMERDWLSERTRAGMATARRRGKRIGRPRVSRTVERHIRALLVDGASISGAARVAGVSRNVVRRVAEGQ